MSEKKLEYNEGLLTGDLGSTHPGSTHARYYYGEGEDAPQNRERIDPATHTTWREADGAVGIRRGTSVSIGASREYSAKYDDVDWGN